MAVTQWMPLAAFLPVFVLLTSLAMVPAASAEMPEHQRLNVLNEALTAFDDGTQLTDSRPDKALQRFRHAAELFESLLADGVRNGRLHYNLGNTFLRLGRIGKAILHYRRAEELIGKDAQVQHNLRYARSLCRTRIEPSPERAVLRTVFFWHYDTSPAGRYTAALVAYVIFWLLLIIQMFVRQPSLRYAAIAMLVLWLAAGTSVAVETIQNQTTRAGVATTDDVVVRKGNGEGYEPQFKEPIHEGVEFTVVDQRGDWYRIELLDGSTGWIRQSEAEII